MYYINACDKVHEQWQYIEQKWQYIEQKGQESFTEKPPLFLKLF